MSGPAPTLIATLIPMLEPVPGVVSAHLFGSESRGQAHRDSDIDVAVVLDRTQHPRPEDRFELRLRLMADLQVATHRTIDLIILNDVPPLLARHVLLDGVLLFAKQPDTLRTFSRTTLSRAADLQPFIDRSRRALLETLAR
jgi:predicted nucleotidyltransferase